MASYHGSLDELKGLLASLGIEGAWEEKPNCWRVKLRDGAGMNWAESTVRIWFDGPAAAKAALQSKIDVAIVGGLADHAVAAKDRIIFVVHGHDHTAKEQLELVLHRLGLEPFVLQDSGGGGKTIIEALEGMIGKEAKSAFGIVLLTPDDMGYSKRDGDKEAKPRARQNVILEMGMLLSSLTRARVAILQKQFLERPSDLDGVLYIPFNDHVKETVPKLAQRLQESGIPLDASAIARASS
jgi:predicted nucleotide-binding protein